MDVSFSQTPKAVTQQQSETAVPSWQKIKEADPAEDGGPLFGSPATRRRVINQSPAPVDPDPVKYRQSPSQPFQPPFYKAPPLEEPQVNPFPLVGSPKVVRAHTVTASSSTSSMSSTSKKLRRKKRAAEAKARFEDGSSDSEEDHDAGIYTAQPASAVEIMDPQE